MITIRNSISGLFLGASLSMMAYAEIDSGDVKVDRLDLQGQIDTQAPLSKTLWAGAHNAYASYQWDQGVYTDVNQWYAPEKLFHRGIRLVEYDVYPASTISSTPHLCHMGLEEATFCLYMFGTAATLGDGFDEITDFLKDNKDEVILVKFEAYDSDYHQNFRNKVGEKIESRLGDYVFKPSDWGYGDDDCASLPVQTLTKQDVLDAGRNIILFTQVPRDYPHTGDNNLCDYHDESNTSKYRRNVWIGVDEMDAFGNLTANEPIAQNGSQLTPDADGTSSAATHYANGNFSVALDATTEYSKDDIKIYGDTVQEKAQAGYNLLELALVEANGTSIGASKAPQIEDYIWSWSDDSLSSDNTCAVIKVSGQVVENDCDAEQAFACVDDDRQWHVSDGKGTWSEGASICEAQGYHFGMPFNALENAALTAKISASLWVNYHQVFDDFWLAGQTGDFDAGYIKKEAVGGSGGDAFDSIDLVKRKLLGSGTMNLTSVQIRSGSRIDGLKACYEFNQPISHMTVSGDTLCIEYGDGDGGSMGEVLSFDTQQGEYLADIKICQDDEKYSAGSVYYVKLTSSTGASINGGTSQGACTTYSSTSSQQLFAFHGRHDDEINALGVHKLSNALVNPGFYATDWLNNDDPTSGGIDYESFNEQKAAGNISSQCNVSDVAGIVGRVAETKLDYSLTGESMHIGDIGTNYRFFCATEDCSDYEVKYFFTNAACVN
ncbi:jacalin-like lectin [uncultured Shewanella sp.]|uniref:jacalin-like lectin n=1 Tax=uncultured Shewanella sp. TaxID=173975 RepID=UPI00260D1745|nr:jacalin-like lectin [uncultured Shewanella sp.]